MRLTAPALREGIHYRRLSVREGGGVYRFETLLPLTYHFAAPLLPDSRTLSYRTPAGEWLLLTRTTATVSARYRWNGNSPKKGIHLLGRDLWLGTPDYPATLAASLLHDAFFQFSGTRPFPVSLDYANACYAGICRGAHFRLTAVYQTALEECSRAYWGKSEPEASCVTR